MLAPTKYTPLWCPYDVLDELLKEAGMDPSKAPLDENARGKVPEAQANDTNLRIKELGVPKGRSRLRKRDG